VEGKLLWIDLLLSWDEVNFLATNEVLGIYCEDFSIPFAEAVGKSTVDSLKLIPT
jgi:hypothetical protein